MISDPFRCLGGPGLPFAKGSGKTRKMPLHETGIGIDTAARRHTDDEIDGGIRAGNLRNGGTAAKREPDANHTADTGEDRSSPRAHRHATFHHDAKTLTCAAADIYDIAPSSADRETMPATIK